MQRLILVRHGQYFPSSLDETGRKQIAELAKKLKATTEGKRVVILSSTAVRAKESAQILGETLGVHKFEQYDALWSERCGDYLLETLELVRSHKDDADILVVVTHLEHTEDFPNYFGRHELGKSSFPEEEIPKGTAWDIDCEKKTIAHIR